MTNYINEEVLKLDIERALLSKFGTVEEAKKDSMIIQNKLPEDVFQEIIAKVREKSHMTKCDEEIEKRFMKEFKVKRIVILSEL